MCLGACGVFARQASICRVAGSADAREFSSVMKAIHKEVPPEGLDGLYRVMTQQRNMEWCVSVSETLGTV
jgi:D-mannonate dehydratase